jgi:hypothetical protein
MTKATPDTAQHGTNGAKEDRADDALDLVMISDERLRELCLFFDHATVTAQFQSRLEEAQKAGADRVTRYAAFLVDTADPKAKAEYPAHINETEIKKLPPRCWNCGAGPACPCFDDRLKDHLLGIESSSTLVRSLRNTLVALRKIEVKA